MLYHTGRIFFPPQPNARILCHVCCLRKGKMNQTLQVSGY